MIFKHPFRRVPRWVDDAPTFIRHLLSRSPDHGEGELESMKADIEHIKEFLSEVIGRHPQIVTEIARDHGFVVTE